MAASSSAAEASKAVQGDVSDDRPQQRTLSPAEVDYNYVYITDLSPLHYSVIYGDLERVKKLLEDGADPNITCSPTTNAWASFGPSPLVLAANQGNRDIVEVLLGSGANVNGQYNFNGYSTALRAAAARGHEGIALLLLDSGANFESNVEILPVPRISVLDYAVIHRMKELLRRALEAEAPAIHAFQEALYRQDVEILRMLLGTYAGPMEVDGEGLFNAAFRGKEDIFNLWLEYGADPYVTGDLKGEIGANVLHCAAWANNVPIATTAITKLGIDVNSQAERGWTPLHYAICRNGYEMVEFLLSQPNIDVNMVATWELGFMGFEATPLSQACASCIKAVPLLLNAGADARYTSEEGYSVLHQFAHYKNHIMCDKSNEADLQKALTKLIAAGADINAKPEEDVTPLHVAMCGSDITRIKLLLEAGAEMNTPAKVEGGISPISVWMPRNFTPLQVFVARAHDSFELVEGVLELFKKRGVDLTAFSPSGGTLLHDAFYWDEEIETVGEGREEVWKLLPYYTDENIQVKFQMINYLLKVTVDASAVNKQGKTALQLLALHYTELYILPQETPEEELFRQKYVLKCRKKIAAVAVPLINAGDCSLEYFPRGLFWPGIEKALFGVWKKAPEKLPLLMSMIDPGIKPFIQSVFLALHRVAPKLEQEMCVKIIATALEMG